MSSVDLYPSANDGGWDANESNAYANDGAYASTAPGVNSSEAVDYGNFGADSAIPEGSTINSVTIEVEWYVSTTASSANLYFQGLISGSPQGTAYNDGSEPTSPTVRSRAESVSYSRADLLDGVFGVRITAQRGAGATGYTAYLDYVKVTVDYTEPAGGTEYPQAVSGGLTSAGVVSRAVGKPGLAGAVTSGGLLRRLAMTVKAGAVQPAGTVSKGTVKGTLSGSVAPSGALQTIRTVLISLAGAVASAGTLARSTAKGLAGAVSSGGLLRRLAMTTVEGGLSWVGDLAAELATGAQVFYQEVSGAVASGGLLRRLAMTTKAGAIAPGGDLYRQAQRSLAGAVSSGGELVKSARKGLAGVASSSGTVSRAVSKVVRGTLSSAGVARRRISKALSGALSWAGNAIGTLLGQDYRGRVTVTVGLANGVQTDTARVGRVTQGTEQVGGVTVRVGRVGG